MNYDVRNELTGLQRLVEEMSSDVAKTVDEILREGLENPLTADEARALLMKVIETVRAGASKRGQVETVGALDAELDTLISHVEDMRRDVPYLAESDDASNGLATEKLPLSLQPFDGIQPHPVLPAPVFHERRVPVNEGFIRTEHLELWDKNERLDIHLNQFRQKYGRDPDSKELMEIMRSTMALPGIEGSDQFEIEALAKSIAVNGVQKPPIIDVDGTLLDGNRRVTACYYILEDDSGEFTAEEKRRAELLKVWQLTTHATGQDRDAVIVSLNFEPDYKRDWPEYVKAQKVHAEWEALLSLEPRANPGRERMKEMRRDIARKFALATNEVTRYINMVGLAREFEDHHVLRRSKDQYAAKHRASERFQYFDELNKGKNPGGVNWSLNQDDSFRYLIFDLLYDGKFRNWQQIRDLKFVYENEDAVSILKKARDEADVDSAKEDVKDAISLARSMRVEQRQTGANTRIQVFTEWFLKLPVKAFDQNKSGCITQENLRRLRDTLMHVESYLGTDGTVAP